MDPQVPQPSPTPPSVKPPLSPQFRSKLPVLIIVGLLIIAAIGAGYFLGYNRGCGGELKCLPKNLVPTEFPTDIPVEQSTRNTPEETGIWKTYEDPTGSFILQHPNHLYETKDVYLNPAMTNIKSAGVLSTTQPYNEVQEKISDIYMEFIIYTKPASQSFEEFITKTALTVYPENTDGRNTPKPPRVITPDVREDLAIDGKPAVWLEGAWGFGPGVTAIDVLIAKNTAQIIHIHIVEGTTGKEHRDMVQYQKNKDLIKQILSTFKFTK